MHENIVNYTAIFQLWAGLCLICFYTNLFEKLTTSYKREEIIGYLKTFRQKVHGLMSDTEQDKYEFQIDSPLKSFKKSLEHLGKISFCFSLTILFVIAAWKESAYNCLWLVITSSIFFIYSLVLILGLPWKRGIEGWSFFAPALFLTVALLLGFKRNFGYELTIENDWLVALIFFSSLASVPVIAVIRYYYDEYSYKLIRKKIIFISEEFNKYTRWKVMPNGTPMETMSAKIRDFIVKHGPDDSAPFIDGYFHDCIDSAIRMHNIWFALVSMARRFGIKIFEIFGFNGQTVLEKN